MTIHTCSFTEKCLEPGGFHGICERHRAEINGLLAPANDRDRPLVGDECPCIPCQSGLSHIMPCLNQEKSDAHSA